MTWNASGNAANVKISLSTDGGNTFPTVLAASTPNDGAESVLIPDMPTTTARIKIEAVGNIYFDISDTNFSIITFQPTPTPTGTPGGGTPTPTCTPGWSAGPVFPAVAVVRAVGAFFPANGHFYAIGGRTADGAGNEVPHPLDFNPANNTWTTTTATLPDIFTNNMACAVLTVGGTPQIYCVGGSNGVATGGVATPTARVFSYDPVTNTITTLTAADNWPGCPAGNFLPGGFAVAGNKLYTIGSFGTTTTPPTVTAEVWQFDPNAAVGSRWLARTPLPVARAYVPAATIGGLIYTAGGSNLDAGGLLIDTTDSFKYDPVTGIWTAIANIPRATGETRAVVMNNQMWVLGGGRVLPNPGNQVDIYDPVSNTWSAGLPFVTGRRNFPTDSDGTARVWLGGGYDATAVLSNTMEIFGPVVCGTPTPTPTPGWGDDPDRRGRLHVAAAGHQPDLYSRGLPGGVDAVHGNGDGGGLAHHRTAGLPLLCGECRTGRSELRFHRYRHVPVQWHLRANANPGRDPNTYPDTYGTPTPTPTPTPPPPQRRRQAAGQRRPSTSRPACELRPVLITRASAGSSSWEAFPKRCSCGRLVLPLVSPISWPIPPWRFSRAARR